MILQPKVLNFFFFLIWGYSDNDKKLGVSQTNRETQINLQVDGAVHGWIFTISIQLRHKTQFYICVATVLWGWFESRSLRSQTTTRPPCVVKVLNLKIKLFVFLTKTKDRGFRYILALVGRHFKLELKNVISNLVYST